MNIAMRRGACPALSTPMQTGDGLLVRLALAEGGISPGRLCALSGLAARHGNGIVDVTARGSLQIRGLTPDSATILAADVAALGLPLREGVPVETSPLAGLDPDEIADPLALVRAIRAATTAAGLQRRLAPKISVVVDSGGNIAMSDILADIRLAAIRAKGPIRWLLAIGGDATTARQLATLEDGDAVPAVVAALEEIAALGPSARGRDLDGEALKSLTSELAALRSFIQPSELPIFPVERRKPEARPPILSLTDGRFAAFVALPFGSIHAGEMTTFLDAVEADEIRLAPQRSLTLICSTADAAHAARETAQAHGLIVELADPRRMLAACPGAPACRSGRIATRDIALRLVESGLIGESTVHVSGCAKGCARPTPTALVLTGTDAGIALIRNGRASDAPFATALDADAALAILRGTPT